MCHSVASSLGVEGLCVFKAGLELSLVVRLYMYTILPGISYTMIKSSLGQCPGGSDGCLTNQSMRIKEGERERLLTVKKTHFRKPMLQLLDPRLNF